MQKNNENLHSNFEENEALNIREEIEKYLFHWKWFLLGCFLALVLAFLYLRYTAPKYTATASILIKDNQKSGISKELEAFKDMGIVGGGSTNNTDNEIEIIKSRKIIGQVIDSLNFDISYFKEGRIITSEVYSDNPIKFHFFEKSTSLFEKDTIFIISIKDSNEFDFKSINEDFISKHKFNTTINSSLGVFNVEKMDAFKEGENQDIFINLRQKSKVVDFYRNNLNINPVSKNSSVLSLSITGNVKEKSEDFLNELIRQYNIDAINDKSEVSKKTRDFIADRINKIGEDLSRIQDSVKEFKDFNNTSGLSMEGELALQNASKSNDKIVELRSELILAEAVYESLNNQNLNKDETLPPNLGFKDLSISESILQYNDLVSRKNNLSLNAGFKNPGLVRYNKEILIQRNNLKKSIQNHVSSLKFQLEQVVKASNSIYSKVSSIPALERGFIDIARQQEIISELFSYLLKKKEETDISLAVTVANAKIIDKAYSPKLPVSPKKKIVYLAALILGLIIPFIIIYLKNLLDTKVHNKKDIESVLTVPFLGDIPKSESKQKIIVGSDARSSGSEAFRLVRTNLDFMMASVEGSKKFIFITSTTSGEGKSFISINLAATLALSGKKVLLLGMDLRAPKVTEYLGLESRKGVTNYITSNNLKLDDLKFTIPEAKGLDIISSGAIPPNPAELLSSSSTEELFAEIKDKENYDYIVVDTAPVNLVTDTLLISKYADMFLYIVRANYLDKRLLEVPQQLYKSKRLPNMSIVLNDTDSKRSYGYGYGGYGSYGYGYLTEDSKPWYKKIFSKS